MARVLAIDDEPAILTLMDRALRAAGFDVSCASCGTDALEAVRTTGFDAAIVDYAIPEPNGLKVLERLRELQPGCVRILMSGAIDLPVTLDAINRGEVSRVIEKPFSAKALVATVSETVAERHRVFTLMQSSGQKAAREELQMLEACLDGDLLQLAVQPIVAGTDLKAVAFEGLLRSRHSVLDGPLPVLRAAEQHGKIQAVAAIVGERAARWLAWLPPDVKLFLNLHPMEITDLESLGRRLRALQPWAERVVLEITERASVLDFATWRACVALVAELGFSMAVDDLGAGYSSLSVLAELKPRYIKVDMSIVRGVDKDLHKRRLVDLLSRFADATGATIVAEGVETPEEAAVVRACGTHLLQGYLFGRPSLERLDAEHALGRRETIKVAG